MTGPRAGPSAHTRPVDESMTLLREVMEHPLDPSYEAAAAHRAEHGPSRLIERVAWGIAAVLIGVGVTAAVIQLRAPQPGAQQARGLLVEQIVAARDAIADIQQTNTDLQQRIQQLNDEALGDVDPALVRQMSLDSLRTGTTAVYGPGVVVTVADGPAQGDDAHDEEARVQDGDVRAIVNTLWASGAEEIAVNGIRLGATSTIRAAGSAVLVDLTAVVSPYEIEAIGEPTTLRDMFVRSQTAADLAVLGSVYGIRTTVVTSGNLTLPAAVTSPLRYAETIEPSPVADTGARGEQSVPPQRTGADEGGQVS